MPEWVTYLGVISWMLTTSVQVTICVVKLREMNDDKKPYSFASRLRRKSDQIADHTKRIEKLEQAFPMATMSADDFKLVVDSIKHAARVYRSQDETIRERI